MGVLLNALTSGIGSLVGAGVQNFANGLMTNKANQFTLDMWNRSAANNATSQVARIKALRDSGFNPQLADMNGSSTSPVGSVAPQTANIPNLGDILNKAFDAQRTKADIDNTNAQTDAIRQNTENAKVQHSLLQNQVKLSENEVIMGNAKIPFASDMAQAESDLLRSKVQETNTLVDKMDAEISTMFQNARVNEQRFIMEKLWKDIEFNLQRQKLSIDEKMMLCSWANAETSRLMANSNCKVNEAQVFSITQEGQLKREYVKRETILNKLGVAEGQIEAQALNNDLLIMQKKLGKVELRFAPVNQALGVISKIAQSYFLGAQGAKAASSIGKSASGFSYSYSNPIPGF
ncbi:minor capsid protein [Capybara microvirus Cap1_SP_48]|nr:minor capsid protein [Capybara microvirus Cap1_SP_48]